MMREVVKNVGGNPEESGHGVGCVSSVHAFHLTNMKRRVGCG